MLRPEGDRLCEVEGEVGGALAGDPVDEVERDVVKSGITQMVERAPDGDRTRLALEHGEQFWPEALRAERDARDSGVPQQPRELGRDGLGIRLDSGLRSRRKPREEAGELRGLGERRRAPSEEHGLDLVGERGALELELGEQRIHVGAVALTPARPA